MSNPSYKINPESEDNWLANTEPEHPIETMPKPQRKPYKNPSDHYSIHNEKE